MWTIRAAYSYAHVDSTDTLKAFLSKNTRPNGYNLGISYTQGKWEADADLNYVTGRSTERFTDSRYLTDESYESLGYTTLGAYAMPSRHFILGGTYQF